MKSYKFKKYTKEGKVAILVSQGYGAGWSTWNCDFESNRAEAMTFDRDLVELVLEDKRQEAERLAENRYGAYAGGADQLKVLWLDKNTLFEINEYDGSESVRTFSMKNYMTA